MVDFLTPDDLVGFIDPSVDTETVNRMITDATALAIAVAPCLADEDFRFPDAVKAILRGVLSRWSGGIAGGLQSYSAGPFVTTYDTRTDRRGVFWPSEIAQLQSLCSSTGVGTTSLVKDDAPEREWIGPDVWRPLHR